MIFVECNPDRVLIRVLGIPSKEIKHAYSKGNVCRRLEKSGNSKGLVDEDPDRIQPSYIKRLQPLSCKDDVKILCDKKTQNYLIMVCPALEEWILKSAKEAGIDVRSYGLPDDSHNLHKTINLRLESFEKLLRDMKGRSKMLKTLERFVKGE